MRQRYGSNWLNTSKLAKPESELSKDVHAGRDAITRAANSTWWSWEDGSTLYFWRWPPELKQCVRDRTPLLITWTLMPNYKKKQQWPKESYARTKLESKLRKDKS